MWRRNMYDRDWCDLILIFCAFWVPAACYFSNVPIRKQFLAVRNVGWAYSSILLRGSGPVCDVPKTGCIGFLESTDYLPSDSPTWLLSTITWRAISSEYCSNTATTAMNCPGIFQSSQESNMQPRMPTAWFGTGMKLLIWSSPLFPLKPGSRHLCSCRFGASNFRWACPPLHKQPLHSVPFSTTHQNTNICKGPGQKNQLCSRDVNNNFPDKISRLSLWVWLMPSHASCCLSFSFSSSPQPQGPH